MPELDAAVSQVYGAYIDELGGAIASLQPWWQQLEARDGRSALRLRWPAGVASHPRVLAIFRDFHRRFSELAQRPLSDPEARFDERKAWADDAAWGDGFEPVPLIPIAPERLLVDRLQVEAPQLHAAMSSLSSLVMSPIGEAPVPRPSLRALAPVELDPSRARRFHVAHRHGIERGIERLLAAPADVRTTQIDPLALDEASEFHRLAHHAYARELELALTEAERWWARELHLRDAQGMTSREAADDVFAAHPCGPVSHPRVLGVIQAYWVLCEEINAAMPASARRVPPEQLLLGWLVDGHHVTWIEVLTAMPYWPIGIDAAGQWV